MRSLTQIRREIAECEDWRNHAAGEMDAPDVARADGALAKLRQELAEAEQAERLKVSGAGPWMG